MIVVLIAVLVVFALHHLIWVAVVSVALLALAAGAARRALIPPAADGGMPFREVPPPRRAFLIMNPRSGGGKVAKFGLKARAEALGAEVALLEGPGVVDVADLARGPSLPGPTCWVWLGATGPRRWWPGSPPNTICRSS